MLDLIISKLVPEYPVVPSNLTFNLKRIRASYPAYNKINFGAKRLSARPVRELRNSTLDTGIFSRVVNGIAAACITAHSLGSI
jgi:hypothetical protein